MERREGGGRDEGQGTREGLSVSEGGGGAGELSELSELREWRAGWVARRLLKEPFLFLAKRTRGI